MTVHHEADALVVVIALDRPEVSCCCPSGGGGRLEFAVRCTDRSDGEIVMHERTDRYSLRGREMETAVGAAFAWSTGPDRRSLGIPQSLHPLNTHRYRLTTASYGAPQGVSVVRASVGPPANGRLPQRGIDRCRPTGRGSTVGPKPPPASCTPSRSRRPSVDARLIPACATAILFARPPEPLSSPAVSPGRVAS
jgi:hypothetical protein